MDILVAAVNWGDVPTWVAGIGTVGTLGAALWQIRNERNRRLAADEQLRRERHVEQARMIAAYLGEEERERGVDDGVTGRTSFYLANNSAEPVYSVLVGSVFLQGTGPRVLEDVIKLHSREQRRGPVTTVSILPGGLYRVWVRGTGWQRVLSGRGAVEVAFTDAAGAHWIRRASGRLEELPEPILDYFGKLGHHPPFEFQTPERVLGGGSTAVG